MEALIISPPFAFLLPILVSCVPTLTRETDDTRSALRNSNTRNVRSERDSVQYFHYSMYNLARGLHGMLDAAAPAQKCQYVLQGLGRN